MMHIYLFKHFVTLLIKWFLHKFAKMYLKYYKEKNRKIFLVILGGNWGKDPLSIIGWMHTKLKYVILSGK